jgi:hypothetical protein
MRCAEDPCSREVPLLVLLVLFLASVVAFGRRQGAQAVLGLALTGVVILAGRSPVAVALVGSLLVAEDQRRAVRACGRWQLRQRLEDRAVPPTVTDSRLTCIAPW